VRLREKARNMSDLSTPGCVFLSTATHSQPLYESTVLYAAPSHLACRNSFDVTGSLATEMTGYCIPTHKACQDWVKRQVRLCGSPLSHTGLSQLK
jgi:hypothetical protein